MARRNRRPINAVNKEVVISSPATEKKVVVAAKKENKPAPTIKQIKAPVAPRPLQVATKKAPGKKVKVGVPLKARTVKASMKAAKKPVTKKTEAEILQEKIDALTAQLKDGATKIGQNKKQVLMDELVELQKQKLALNKVEAKVVTAKKTDTVANRPKGTKSSLTASRAYI